MKKNFSTGDWLKLVTKKIVEVRKRKKIPIIVGGTGLYFKALTDGLVNIPNIPLRLRKQIRSLQLKIGNKRFYQELLKVDPISRDKINPTDTQRLVRAYEVKKFTKKSIHVWFKNTKSKFEKNNFFKIYIDFDRNELIERINLRTHKMLKEGAINEVNNFIKLRIRKDKTAHKAIGLNEIKAYLSKEKNLDEIKEKISIKTRQYAKRQSTWARGNMENWIKLKPKDINKFLKKI